MHPGSIVAFVMAGCGYRSAPAATVGDAAPPDAGLDGSVAARDGGSDAASPRWRYEGGDGGPKSELLCDGLPSWSATDAESEWRLLAAINAARSVARRCPRGRSWEADPPLPMNPALRCAAREVAIQIESTGTTEIKFGMFVDRATFDLLLRWGYHAGIASREFARADSADAAVQMWLTDPDLCNGVMIPLTDFGGGVRSDIWVAIGGYPY